MKKTLVTIAIILGMTLCATAQNGGGLFQRGTVSEETFYQDYNTRDGSLILPIGHGESGDANATPFGSGIALLVGLGSAYLVAKKSKKD